jgi:hypothetical protein
MGELAGLILVLVFGFGCLKIMEMGDAGLARKRERQMLKDLQKERLAQFPTEEDLRYGYRPQN